MPAGRISLAPKKLSETCFGSSPFDFTSVLQPGETINSASCSSLVFSGYDTDPSAVIDGAAVVQTPQVLQLFTGGQLGCIYEIACEVTTSLGQTLTQTAYLAIIPDLS